MAHAAANDGQAQLDQLITIDRANGLGHHVEVRKGGTRADKRVAPDDAHLQTSILRHHRVLAECRHEQRRPEG